MELNEKINGFENMFREKLESYSPDYNPKDWNALRKGLKAKGLTSSGMQLGYYVAISIVVVSTILAYVLLNNHNDSNIFKTTCLKNVIDDKNSSQLLENNSNKVQNSNVIAKPKVKDIIDIKTDISKTGNENKQAFINNLPKNENLIINVPANINPVNSENYTLLNPNADFTFDIIEGCSPLKVKFTPKVKSDTMIYLWNFGDGKKSTKMYAENIYETPGKYSVSLTVKYFKSEKINTNISDKLITVKSSPKAEFYKETDNNKISYRNISENYDRIEWFMGERLISNQENIIQTFVNDGNYKAQLIAYNNNGCNDTITDELKVEIQHNYFMPTAFVPNGDSRNETFGPVGDKLSELNIEMYIYNKFGQLIFESVNQSLRWNGKIQGSDKLADEGVYVWIIISKDKYGNIRKKQGNVTLINKQ